MVPSQKKLVAKKEDKSSCKSEAKVLMSQAIIQKEEQHQPK